MTMLFPSWVDDITVTSCVYELFVENRCKICFHSIHFLGMMKFTIKIIQNNFYLKNQLLILFNDNGHSLFI